MFDKQISGVAERGSTQNASKKASRNSKKIIVTGKEVSFKTNEIIVSKTDLAGKIKYVNDIFIKISGYSEVELIGKPHNMVRHPDMPRAVYQLLWDRLGQGKHVFAYVVNLCKNGDHYWVLAHVCPSFDTDGNVIGYHSSRRKPDMAVVNGTIIPLYKQLLEIETEEASKRLGLEKSSATIDNLLATEGVSYNEFIISL